MLRLNGAHDLAVHAGVTSFRFGVGADLPSGTGYTVTASSIPGAPGQRCAVSQGRGIVDDAPVTNVVISCAPLTFGAIATAGDGSPVQPGDAHGMCVNSREPSFNFGHAGIAQGAPWGVSVAEQAVPPAPTRAANRGASFATSALPVVLASSSRTPVFAVGGIVTGLSGHGLVLRLNGTHDLTLPAGATSFQFGRGRAGRDTNYEVTLAAQPTSPAQTCVVFNGRGP